MAITAADAQELIRCLKSNRDLSQLEAWGMFQWQVGRCEDLRSREERDDPEDEPWQCGAWRVTSDPSAEGEGYLKWGPKEPPRLPSDLDPEWEMSYTRRPPVWQHYREPAPQIPSNGREVISAPYIRAVQMKRSRASIRVLMLQRLHSLRIRLTVISPSVCTPYSIPSLLSQSLVSNPHIQTQNKFSGANGFGGSLCSSCANTPFQKLLHFQTIKYRLLSNVSASGRRLCKLCEMVDEIAGAGDRSEERILDLYFESQSPVFLHRVNHVPHAKFVSPASIDVKNKSISTPYHLLPHPIGSLAVLPEAGSEYHLSLLRIWLQQCQETHDHSVPHQLLPAPSRLLDIGDLDRTGTVCLRDSLSPGTKYVALSHRWGISQPVITTKENLNERQKGIQFFQLPKTFQDAVVVTRGLGIHHLWIDSLCIVQNDPEDWQREAKKMEEVFSFAHCTISATSASGCHQGFLHRSPGNSVRVLSLNDNPPIGVWFTRLPSNFKHDVESSVLNQRAWVFQERALSLRNIHFTASQTYFQCEAGVWCETTGKTKIRGSVNDWLRPIAMANASLSTAVAKRLNGPKSLFPIPFSHLRHDPTDAFMHYLSYYSRLAITKQSDRPLAILGLESRLAVSMRAISLYGVLISSFCRTLFWHRLGDLPLKRIDFAHDLVPSWSWMRYEGAINYGMLQGTISSKYIAWGGDIRLNNAGMIAPVQENRFSILVPVSLLTKNCVVRRGRMQQEVTHGGEVVAWIRRDDPDEEEDLRDLRSVIVGQVSNTLEEDHSSLDELQRSRSYWSCVLLVRPFYKGNQAVKETYQRVGVGIVRTKHLSPDKQVDRVWVV